MKNYENLRELLNLSYLSLTNKTISCGKMDLPAINCNVSIYPDYIALYSEPGKYFLTDRTALGFFEFDEEIDGKNGLFWAIYYNVEERLDIFKERFKGVKYVIIPDYSVLGDIHRIENNYRLFRGRIVGLWFMFALRQLVPKGIWMIPLRTCDYEPISNLLLINCLNLKP